MTEKSVKLMNAKKASVLPVVNILKLKKWKLTTSRHGVRVEKLLPKIARCFVKIVIGEKVACNYLPIIFKTASRLSSPPAPSFRVIDSLSGSQIGQLISSTHSNLLQSHELNFEHEAF